VWFELVSEHVSEAQRFYGTLFGWEFSPSASDSEYWLIMHHGEPIGGLIALPDLDPEVPESVWLSSLSVADVDQAVATLRTYQGTVLEEPREVPGRGRMTVVQDPEGAPLVFLRAVGGDPAERPVRPGDWLWIDLFTRNRRVAMDFYTALAGVTVQTLTEADGQVVHLFQRDGRPQAGLVEMALDGVEAHWLPYVRVTDIKATVARATALGGSIILRQADVAILADPSGAAIGVQEHN
jgi:predicted enzyme related to lactoylglutathione lyase